MKRHSKTTGANSNSNNNAINADTFVAPDYAFYLARFAVFDDGMWRSFDRARYDSYLLDLLAYLVGFITRTNPLFDLAAERADIAADFARRHDARDFVSWPPAATAATNGGIDDPLFCTPCQRRFAKDTVFNAHLSGAKHKQAVSGASAPRKLPPRELLALEHEISMLAGLLEPVIEQTMANVERKASSTIDERQAEIDQELAEIEADELGDVDAAAGGGGAANDDDDVVDKPLLTPQMTIDNYPVGWDGKPIPYWLYRLHGLGVEYKCFREADHQILTNRGFLFLDQVEAHVQRAADGAVLDWRGLTVASYDVDAQRLVFRRPRALVVNDGLHELVEFGGSDNVSLVATRQHSLFVRLAHVSNERVPHLFHKTTVEELLAGEPPASVRCLAVAYNGVDSHSLRGAAPSVGSARSGSKRKTTAAPVSLREQPALLELYGFWLANDGLVARDATAAEFLTSRIELLGAAPSTRSYVDAEGATHFIVGDAAIAARLRLGASGWFADWVWQLDTPELRSIVCGMARAFGAAAAVAVAGEERRDALVNLMLFAGYSPTFVAGDGDVWIVDNVGASEPLLHVRDARQFMEHCRSWCFDVSSSAGASDGFVVVRRAERRKAGDGVAAAGRATIQGNCEICANTSYWGLKNFQVHFQQWRHAQGMAALGIPNTKHFQDITSIEDAQALWRSMQQQDKAKSWHAQDDEEFEDEDGNVFARKTFLDLQRQGLLSTKRKK